MDNHVKELLGVIANHIASRREEVISEIEAIRDQGKSPIAALSLLGEMKALSGVLWKVHDRIAANHSQEEAQTFRNRAWPILPDDPSEVSGERVA